MNRFTSFRTLRFWIGLLSIFPLFHTSIPVSAEDQIKNPYYKHRQWKVWELDPEPITIDNHLSGDQTLSVPSEEKRLYPQDPPGRFPPAQFLQYVQHKQNNQKYAGFWSDVYASWDQKHSFINRRWHGSPENSVPVRDHMITFVGASFGAGNKEVHVAPRTAGVNYASQSTTSMGHPNTNRKGLYSRIEERMYFSNMVFAGPANSSYKDLSPRKSIDRYKALSPVFYNSIGASGSETLALAKMIIAGGYLPKNTKIQLKKHGLFASAMLYLWKSGLPFDVPYEHELRHRVVYNSVGNQETYPGSYSFAGMNYNKACLLCHRYDEQWHVANMVDRARNMETPPPEAIVDVRNVSGAETVYDRTKTVLLERRKETPVTMKVSTGDSYDLQDRPVTTNVTLLYGNPDTRIKKLSAGTYWIKIPPDKNLPRGRTSILVTANNQKRKGNPAVINLYRPEGPPNLRPGLPGFQDRAVTAGEHVSLPLSGIDPEGYPVTFEKRSTDPGTLKGNQFQWTIPSDIGGRKKTITVLASDGTAGNSYNAEQITFHLNPTIFARIQADRTWGKAPLKTTFDAGDSFDKNGSLHNIGWTIRRSGGERIEGGHGKSFQHTFRKPGRYQVQLTVKGPSGSHTNQLNVFVHDDQISGPERSKSIQLYGKNTRIPAEPSRPSVGNGTNFDGVAVGDSKSNTFWIYNRSDQPVQFSGDNPIKTSGKHSSSFNLQHVAADFIPARGSVEFTLQFQPESRGSAHASVSISLNERTISVPVTGYGK